MKEFTENEALEMMHKGESISLRKIADYVEKHKLGYQDVVAFLREVADEHEAQVMVIKLRDEMKYY
jgi:hypothetical protein